MINKISYQRLIKYYIVSIINKKNDFNLNGSRFLRINFFILSKKMIHKISHFIIAIRL